jgi:CheY-like chemotaxis protein
VTVLVVEDDPAVRELVSLHLARAGFDVEEAPTAARAWEIVHRVDMIVLDRMLPDESGDAFLARLRATPDMAAKKRYATLLRTSPFMYKLAHQRAAARSGKRPH